jgi:hypothetical protein
MAKVHPFESYSVGSKAKYLSIALIQQAGAYSEWTWVNINDC